MNDVATLRVPPNSADAEQAVLGAVFAQPDCLQDILLQPEDFYRREHKTLWQTMQAMAQDQEPIDVLTVSERLAQAGTLNEAGGIDFLVDLASLGTSANALHYASIVKERALDRRMISAAHRIADMGYNPDDSTVYERLSSAQAMLAEIEAPTSGEVPTLDERLRDAVSEMERRHAHKGEMIGLPTGFADIDRRTQGFMPGDLVVVAGRPGSGKTTFAMNVAEHVALQGGLVVVFSLEMSGQQLTLRTLSSIGRIPFDQIRTADLRDEQWDKLTGTVGRLRGKHLRIDDSSLTTSAQVLAQARRISRQLRRPLDLVVVDYLQLLTDQGDGVDRVTKISRNLKLAGRELGCPIVALSQLSRKVEERSDKRPIMSDLRESGAVEQDADMIFMLYRDEYYNPESSRKGIAEALCRKFRNGEVGDDFLVSNLHLCRFDNMSPGSLPPNDPPKRKGGYSYD